MGGYLGNTTTRISSSFKHFAYHHHQFGMVAVGYEKYGSQEKTRSGTSSTSTSKLGRNQEDKDQSRCRQLVQANGRRRRGSFSSNDSARRELSLKKYKEAYDQLKVQV